MSDAVTFGREDVEHIVSGFASLARALGISVSAEAVDSADQAKLLRTLGCDLALGPYFGEPLPMCEVVSRHGLGDGGRVRSKTVGL